MKPRILFCTEASWLSTGYAVYAKEILNRLHETNLFELAEMGAYANQGDPKVNELPWKFYGVLPQNQNEKQIYESNQFNAFGAYKFDAVVADFQPDIVFGYRDPWMDQHIQNSKFRSLFKFVLMPTVDSAPQRRDWVNNLFKQTDVLTAYSRFGKRTLESEGLKVAEVTSPGIHPEIFRPLDKAFVRDKYQLKQSLFIIGTVMRNQKRKLFPELFETYAKLRAKYPLNKKKPTKKAARIHHSVLLCHTSWPDNGWDIPELLNRSNIARHVIFTYKCEACKEVFHSWFIPCDAGGKGICRVCGEQAAHMPNTHSGVTTEQLVEIYNLMDLYVQPAICEGWGLPIMEAKSCGVPGLYQNYSAMEDHVENGGGLPIKIGQMYTEAETMAKRSLPDKEDFLKKLELLILDNKKRDRLSKEARECAVELHNWDLTADKFKKIFQELELHNRDKTWDRPPQLNNVKTESPPRGLSDEDFVQWCYMTILERAPDQKGFNDWVGTLKKGGTRESVLQYFRNEIIGGNIFEKIRWETSCKLRGIEIKEEVDKDKLFGVLI